MTQEDLIQLAYASTSANAGSGGGTAVDVEIPRILRSCKVNNPKLEIGGVLHYGDGYFFQVLEGPQAAVDHLYEKISKDPRHTDVRTIDRRFIRQRRFPDWSMKYVPMEEDVEKLLQRHGFKQFNPYALNEGIIEEMIALLVGSPAPEQKPDQDYRNTRSQGSWLKRLLGRA